MNFQTPDFSTPYLGLESLGLRSLGLKSSWLARYLKAYLLHISIPQPHWPSYYPGAVGAPRSTSHHRDDGLALQILLSHLERVDRKC